MFYNNLFERNWIRNQRKLRRKEKRKRNKRKKKRERNQTVIVHLRYDDFTWFSKHTYICTSYTENYLNKVSTFQIIASEEFFSFWGCHGHDLMVVGFTTTYAIGVYHHWSCEFEPRSWRGVLYTTLCDKVCQWLATARWFSPGTPVSSTNKSDRHNINKILLKAVLNTINLTLTLDYK